VAEAGDVVKKGGVVARLDDSMLKLQYASDSANVARLEASLRYDQAQADRMQRLMSASAVATSTRDQAVSQRDVDTAQLAQARADSSRTKYQLDHSEIRSPFPGRVAQRLIQPGEYAAVGKDIVRLVDIDDIELTAQAPIDSTRFLREGAPITVEIEGRALTAKLRAIVPVGDQLSRTVELRVALNAGDGVVGDASKVFVPSAIPRDVLAVPRDALVLREDNTYVFKVSQKNVAERITVETGSEDGALVEVHGALAPGERVIVRGAERLEAGQKVRAISAS
jgi:RND family efflux transporter MFP subunit